MTTQSHLYRMCNRDHHQNCSKKRPSQCRSAFSLISVIHCDRAWHSYALFSIQCKHACLCVVVCVRVYDERMCIKMPYTSISISFCVYTFVYDSNALCVLLFALSIHYTYCLLSGCHIWTCCVSVYLPLSSSSSPPLSLLLLPFTSMMMLLPMNKVVQQTDRVLQPCATVVYFVLSFDIFYTTNGSFLHFRAR